jgi:F-type H+-transporting ATPase subunit epsilon
MEILTPGAELMSGEVSEVVLPSHNGEVGVLAGHEDFIGLLGTGSLKLVKDGQDHWFVISGGVYEVRDGALVLYAVMAQDSDSIDEESAQSVVKRLEAIFNDPQKFSAEEYPEQKLEYDRNAARVEVARRMTLN